MMVVVVVGAVAALLMEVVAVAVVLVEVVAAVLVEVVAVAAVLVVVWMTASSAEVRCKIRSSPSLSELGLSGLQRHKPTQEEEILPARDCSLENQICHL